MSVAATQEPGQDRRADDRRRQSFIRPGAVDPEGPIFGGRNPTEALTGFDGLTNGMDPAGPAVRHAERGQRRAVALVQRQPVHLRRGRDRRRWPRARPTTRSRAASATRTSSPAAPARWPSTAPADMTQRPVLRVAGRVAGAFARHASRHRGAWSPSRTTSAPSASRPTRSATALSRRSPTARCWRSRRSSRTRCAARAVVVPVLERPTACALGRFGWKNQHASLESFSADAYLNEMGITSAALPRGEHLERPRS